MFHTSIHFDNEIGEFVRRDVALDVWEDELKERTPLAYWRTTYVKPDSGKPKVEISSRESPESLLRRLIDEDQEHTEHARYILALMLERKKQLVPKETKYTEQGTLLLYEHRKSGEVFIIRDPELRLDEIESVQEEVATLLGFGGPVVEAARVAGVTLTADGKIEKKEETAETGAGQVVPASEEVEAETPGPESEAGQSAGAVEAEPIESNDNKPDSEKIEDDEVVSGEVEHAGEEPMEPDADVEASSGDETESKTDETPS